MLSFPVAIYRRGQHVTTAGRFFAFFHCPYLTHALSGPLRVRRLLVACFGGSMFLATTLPFVCLTMLRALCTLHVAPVFERCEASYSANPVGPLLWASSFLKSRASLSRACSSPCPQQSLVLKTWQPEENKSVHVGCLTKSNTESFSGIWSCFVKCHVFDQTTIMLWSVKCTLGLLSIAT